MTSGAAIDHLAPGAYTVHGAALAAGDYDYAAPDAPLTVTAGETAAAQLTYLPTTGALDVAFTALPAGVTFGLTGPDGSSRTVTIGAHLTHLTPGTYALHNATITQSGFRYDLQGTGNVTVAAGQSVTLNAAFTATDIAPPTGITLTVPSGTLIAPADVTLTARAQDNVGVTAFRLYRADQLVDTKAATANGDGTSGTTFDVTALPAGSFIYHVVAVDGQGNIASSADQTITIHTPNQAPSVVGTAAPQTLQVGAADITVNAATLFTDADGDPLTYTAVSSDPAAATVSMAGSTVTVHAVQAGSTTITLSASDGKASAVSTTFTVTVTAPSINHAPTIAVLPDVRYLAGTAAPVVSAQAFSDPDGDSLTITAVSDTPGVVTPTVIGGAVRLDFKTTTGLATITVTATDPRGASATRTFHAIAGVRGAFISDYVDGTDGRAAVQVYAPDDGSNLQQSGYELTLYQFVKSTSQVKTIKLPMMPFYMGMPYIVINSTFYDFFDITNAAYYNDEALFSQTGSVLNAVVLKKNGVLVDVLGDPTATGASPILANGGTLVRNSGTLFGTAGFLPVTSGEWNIYPKDSFQFLGTHQP